MRRAVLLAALFVGIACPLTAEAGIWNLNAGLGTERLTDRDLEERSDSINLLAAASYTSPTWEFTLGLQLRWDTEGWVLDQDIWNRKGDLLRPIETLVYSRPDSTFSAGLEVMNDWTPGSGYLIRDLSGRAEIDYALPGFRLQWTTDNLKMEVGMDRPVDPTVQAAVVKWEPWKEIQVVIESAVDPNAPLSFTGDFNGGRPKADNGRRITGSAAGILFPVRDGQVLDIKAGGHGARLNGEASGVGWEFRISLDMSRYYLNRLSLSTGSVRCSGGYIPAWFDAVYPVQRWGFSGQPLLDANPLDADGEDRRMEVLDVMYELGNTFRISAGLDRFTDDSVKRARFLLELKESGGRGLQAKAWSRADGPDEELFKVDENFFTRVSALYAFMPHMLLKVSYDRSWAFQEDKGGLVPLSSILLGVIYNISL